MTIAPRDQVRAAVARALTLDPAAGAGAAIAATAQALCLPPEAVADAAGLCVVCARPARHATTDRRCVPVADDAPMPLRGGGVIDPRCAWPFPTNAEVHA